VQLHIVHVPGELDLRVIMAHIYHHTGDLGGQGDGEDILRFWGEDEYRWSTQDFRSWCGI
jgi:hypothetical protein